MGVLLTIFPGCFWTVLLQISTSHIARIIGMSHQHLAQIWIFKVTFLVTYDEYWMKRSKQELRAIKTKQYTWNWPWKRKGRKRFMEYFSRSNWQAGDRLTEIVRKWEKAKKMDVLNLGNCVNSSASHQGLEDNMMKRIVFETDDQSSSPRMTFSYLSSWES
jgi:murein L,D-transpeptidase YafK